MTDPLAPAVAARKAEILRLGQHAVAQRGTRRRVRRQAAAMVLLATGATVLAYALAPARLAPSTGPIAAHQGGAVRPTIAITRLATTAGLATTLAAEPGTSVQRVASAATIARVHTRPTGMDQRLTDQQALALLKEAGTPAGIIRIDGRATLVYHDQPRHDAGPSGLAPARDRGTLARLEPYRPM